MSKFLSGLLAVLLTTVSAYAATVVRPSNATPYTGVQALQSTAPGYMTFPACNISGANMVLIEVDIASSNNPATKLPGTLWLFSKPPSAASLLADQAPFIIAPADFANLIGGTTNGIPFTLASAQNASATQSGVSLSGNGGGLNSPLVIQCPFPDTNVYGLLEAGAYTPSSGETITVKLWSLPWSN